MTGGEREGERAGETTKKSRKNLHATNNNGRRGVERIPFLVFMSHDILSQIRSAFFVF